MDLYIISSIIYLQCSNGIMGSVVWHLPYINAPQILKCTQVTWGLTKIQLQIQ